MNCKNCTAEELTGCAIELSQSCEGPLDGEFVRNGELLVSFRALCGAIVAKSFPIDNRNPHQLRTRPTEESIGVVVNLSSQQVSYPQTA